MNSVEKAAERLKTREFSEPARVEPAFDGAGTGHSSVERLQDRLRAAREPEPAPARHLDLAAFQRAGLLPAEESADHFADEIRRIKQPLLANLAGKGTKRAENAERIMVASALPGEGKTFISLNLALSLAKERDFEVVLVDGDVPKYDITRLLKLEKLPGLMDLLMDAERAPADVIVRTDWSDLMVVPVGRRTASPAEWFGSQRMEWVLRELGRGSKPRLLLFDSPPLLATSEAQVLASGMGQVVVVIAAGETPQQAVKSALQSLDGSKCISLVLNRSRSPASGNYYGRYYYPYHQGS